MEFGKLLGFKAPDKTGPDGKKIVVDTIASQLTIPAQIANQINGKAIDPLVARGVNNLMMTGIVTSAFGSGSSTIASAAGKGATGVLRRQGAFVVMQRSSTLIMAEAAEQVMTKMADPVLGWATLVTTLATSATLTACGVTNP